METQNFCLMNGMSQSRGIRWNSKTHGNKKQTISVAVNFFFFYSNLFLFSLFETFILTSRFFYDHYLLSDQERLKALEVHLPTVDYYRKLQETDRELDRIEPLDVKRGNPLGRDR